MSNQSITLWGVNVSPFVRKVRVALAEKGINYTQQEVLPVILADMTEQSVPDAFKSASPMGQIPALTDGEFSISDSAVINRYLDQKYSDTYRLYPDEPMQLAQTLWFENYADTVMRDIIYKKVFLERVVKPAVLKMEPDTETVDSAIKNELPDIFDYLNHATTGNEFLVDGLFSAADIAVVTHFVCLDQCNVAVPEQYSALRNYVTRVLSRPSFKTALADPAASAA